MGYVEKHRHVHLLHGVEAEHVHYQVVVTKGRAALAQDDFIVARFQAFIDDVAHFVRGEELRLFHVDNRAGARHGVHQIGLAAQKGRQLQNIGHLRRRRGLVGLVDVGNHRHVVGCLNIREPLQTLFQTRPAERIQAGAVGFVEAGFEHIGNIQFAADFYIGFGNFHGQIAAFQHVHAAKQNEGAVVGNGEAVKRDLRKGGLHGACPLCGWI